MKPSANCKAVIKAKKDLRVILNIFSMYGNGIKQLNEKVWLNWH